MIELSYEEILVNEDYQFIEIEMINYCHLAVNMDSNKVSNYYQKKKLFIDLFNQHFDDNKNGLKEDSSMIKLSRNHFLFLFEDFKDKDYLYNVVVNVNSTEKYSNVMCFDDNDVINVNLSEDNLYVKVLVSKLDLELRLFEIKAENLSSDVIIKKIEILENIIESNNFNLINNCEFIELYVKDVKFLFNFDSNYNLPCLRKEIVNKNICCYVDRFFSVSNNHYTRIASLFRKYNK